MKLLPQIIPSSQNIASGSAFIGPRHETAALTSRAALVLSGLICIGPAVLVARAFQAPQEIAQGREGGILLSRRAAANQEGARLRRRPFGDSLDQASLAEGGQLTDPAGYVERMNRLMLELLKSNE